MLIGDLLDLRAIAPHVSGGSKRQILGVIADVAARSYGLEAAVVLDALLERESAGSTGLGHGVAVPHARIPGLSGMKAVFVKLDTPTAFEAVDDQPVDLLLALLAPETGGSEHLRALASVSRRLRQPELRQQLRQARTADAIHALLVREARSTAA
ncbi:PTS IIA-like nitrogen regulatory protein PtsN [Caulobacter ginsengisoli]|uniref:PTS IIA-like nitrogen regulatory protein PtsN n=1 Tax=Caulobacter ginsengisoli TaxID=400775 RepID=UPI0027D8EF99|nr:PTS IIA-like nitrogen regulatory protein PtsN [Caulobacter ginsengisoli]